MLAALAAVLALAGAPASTPVSCSPAPLQGESWGLTHLAAQPMSIELYAPLGCFALVYAGDSELQRFVLSEDMQNAVHNVADGLLVDLHEANHVALRTAQECRVENAASNELPALLAQLRLESPYATHDADAYDAFIRATYNC